MAKKKQEPELKIRLQNASTGEQINLLLDRPIRVVDPSRLRSDLDFGSMSSGYGSAVQTIKQQLGDGIFRDVQIHIRRNDLDLIVITAYMDSHVSDFYIREILHPSEGELVAFAEFRIHHAAWRTEVRMARDVFVPRLSSVIESIRQNFLRWHESQNPIEFVRYVGAEGQPIEYDGELYPESEDPGE